jgi:hypothetical protein
MSADMQAFHADMLALEQRLDDTLRAAALRPLTSDEILDLRLVCGIPDRARKATLRPVNSSTFDELIPF